MTPISRPKAGSVAPPFAHLFLRNQSFCEILACVHVIPPATQAPDPSPHATADLAGTGSHATEDLAGDLFAVIVYLHKHCNADLFEAVAALELTLTQIKLLHHLDDAPAALTLKHAAELVHVSLPGASRMVDDLVRRGFVDRYEDLEDRRMKRVRATDAARAVIRRLNAARLHGLQEFARGLTDTERGRFAAALSTLLERPDVAACRPEGPDR